MNKLNCSKKVTLVIIFLIILFICLFYAKGILYETNRNLISEEDSRRKQKELLELINIDSLSNDFMNNYFNEVKSLTVQEHEKLLIVVSKKKIHNTYGAYKVIDTPNNTYYLVYDSVEKKDLALKKLLKDKDILDVEENMFFYDANIESGLDNYYENNTSDCGATFNSWGINKLGYDDAMIEIERISREYPDKINDVVVAVVDTGFQIDKLKGCYGSRIKDYFSSGDSDPEIDENGHGTHVASTIADATSSNVSLVLANARVAKYGSSSTITLRDAINTIIFNKIQGGANTNVISISAGALLSNISEDVNGDSLYASIYSAYNNNIVVVAASGNNGMDVFESPFYPSSFYAMLSVSAVDYNLEKTVWSNYGKRLSLDNLGELSDFNNHLVGGVSFAAPGYMIGALNKFGYSEKKNGTSMATPHVSAAVAILKSFNLDLSLENATFLLKKYAIDIGDDGYDENYGYGVVNFNGAQWCDDGVDCDEYGVFKNNDISSLNTIKIKPVVKKYVPKYNYGSLTNIINAEIKLYYNNDDYYVKTLSQLIDKIDIIDYDPHDYSEQDVTIKYDNLYTTFLVDNSVIDPANLVNLESDGSHMGWKYNVLSDNSIELIDFNYDFIDTDGDKIVDSNNVKHYGDKVKDYLVTDSPQVIYVPQSLVIFDHDSNEYRSYNVSSLGEGIFKQIFSMNKNSIKRVYIPSCITKIAKDAFMSDTSTKSVDYQYITLEIPLEIIFIGDNNIDINEDAFSLKYKLSDNKIYNGKRGRITFYTYNNSYLYNYTVNYFDNIRKNSNSKEMRKVGYFYLSDKNIELLRDDIKAFDKINVEDLNINVSYSGKINGKNVTETVINEKIDDFEIKYNNGDSLSLKDTSFIVSFDTKYGHHVEEEVAVSVSKAIPKYEIPAGLEGRLNQNLSDIKLPEGFEWMDDSQVLSEIGEKIYKAKYIPKDTDNYEIVENIDIVVLVKRNVVKPIIEIDDKVYDGKNDVSLSSVKVTNLDSSDYEVLSAQLTSVDVGESKAKVRIKLTDNAFKSYSFENDNQEQEFEVNVKIKKALLNDKNDSSDNDVVYDGDEHSILIDLKVEDYEIKYSLDNKDFNLKILPKFKDVGEYTVYYKVTSNNYEDLLGSNKVRIYGIRGYDKTISLRDDIFVVKNNSFINIKDKIDIYSKEVIFNRLDKNRENVSSDIIKTGDIIGININNTKTFEYKISIIGDINSDGKISSADYVKIRKHIMNSELIKEKVYVYSADINNDDKITSADYIRIRKYIMNGESL